jgi:lipopolysaccharide export system ATP-binding protein
LLLSLEDAVKTYQGRNVVDGVSLEVRQGEVVGLLGPNGAGKTTSFYMIVGLVPPNRGRVRFDSEDITKMPMYQRARRGIGYLAQEPSVFRRLTVEQNLLLVLEMQPLTRAERLEKANALMEKFGVTHLRDQLAYQLSGGERRRVEIARALATDPQFMLLDEPFTGIDPRAVDDIQAMMSQMKAEGIGILVTDHSVRETLQITNRAYILHEGRVIASGTPEQVLQDPLARRFYFGDRFNV